MKEKKPTFEVLISAMHQKDFSIAYKTKINSDLLIINQCDEEKYDEIQVGEHTWRMISTRERGSHFSRQMALDNARGEICLFCDDDEEFVDGYSSIVLQAYKDLPKASAIVFNVNRINYKMKKTYYKIKKIRKAPKYRAYATSMLSIKLKDIKDKNIRMSEIFGSGSVWGGGEDSLFEADIHKSGLKLYEHPATIATIDYGNGSNWFTGYDKKYFYNLGAFSEYKYKKNFIIKYLRMIYTCYKLRREKDLSPFEKIKWMRLGMKGIKNNVTYKEYVKKYGE